MHLLVRDAERAGGHLDDLWVLVCGLWFDCGWLVRRCARSRYSKAVRRLSVCIVVVPDIYLGVQSLPHLGAPVGDQHGPVLVHVHQRAALLCFVLGGWDGTG